MDTYELAGALFGARRIEGSESPLSRDTTIYGTAKASDDGRVLVHISDDVTTAEDDGLEHDTYIELPTEVYVEDGDDVAVKLSGDSMSAATVTGVVGGGDRMSGRIGAIEADYVKATELDADVATIGYLKATSATITDLQADTAKVHDLTAQQLSAATGFVGDLTASNITAQTIAADSLKLQGIDTQQISADHATIGSLDTTYAQIDGANITTATIRDAWVDKLMVQSGLIAHEGTVYSLDAIQVNAANITAGTIEVERLIVSVTEQGQTQKYLVHYDPTTGDPSYEKLDGNIIEPRTITADKIVAGAITAQEITTENIVGTGGWINLRNGTFNYTNATTGAGISWDGATLSIRGTEFVTKVEAYQSAQPNLAPLGSVDLTNVYNATTNPNGYWRSALSFWFTKLDDGWIHVERDNSEGTAEVTSGSFRPSACPSVVPGKPYTVLIEVRNNSSSGTNRVDFYINQTANNQFWGNATGDAIDADHVTTTTQINLLTCGQSYVQHAYRIADTEHLTSGTPSPEVFRFNFRCGAGSAASFDFRMSLYDGIYDGPYKPYAGVQLYATQAELDVQADKIALVVDGTSTSSSLVLTDKAINAVTDNLTIKGSDGTTTVISGGEIVANSLTIGEISQDTQADILNENVQVGGRNLLRKTSSWTSDDWVLTRSTVVDGNTIKLTPTTSSAYAKLKVNYLDYSEHSSGDYTLSFEYRVADDSTSYTSTQLVAYVGFNVASRSANTFNTSYDNYLNYAVSTDITSTWTRCVVTVSIPLGLTSGTTAALVTGSNLTVQFSILSKKKPVLIRNIKLEKGTRATDWTPAPEDVDAGISSAAQTATNYIVADSSGIKIADSNPANATTFLHLASTFLDFVRGGSSMLKAWLDGAVAKVRIGLESGNHILVDDSGVKAKSGSDVAASFGGTVENGVSEAHVYIGGDDQDTSVWGYRSASYNAAYVQAHTEDNLNPATQSDTAQVVAMVRQNGQDDNYYESLVSLIAQKVQFLSPFDRSSYIQLGKPSVVTSSPNAVSVATSSNVTLGSIALAAGTWMVVVSTTFASNSSGRRVVYFADDSSVSSVGVGQMASLTQAPANGGMTKYSSFAIVTPTASTTYYCRAWQNSGSTLSCQCYLRAVRIA